MAQYIRLDNPIFGFSPDDESTVHQHHGPLFKDSRRRESQEANLPAGGLTALPEAGSAFLGFNLCAELGQGGIARVYLARQGDLADRPVVVKIAPDLWGEANALAQLHHPNIVPVYSVHYEEPFQAFCMPYLGLTTFQDVLHVIKEKRFLPTSGQFFGEVIKKSTANFLEANDPGLMHLRLSSEKPSSPSAFDAQLPGLTFVEAIEWLALQLADGLAHAHAHGIVHHDLKPANLLLSDEGRPMLLDFNAAEDTKRQTGHTGVWTAGTLPYMAPEQLAVFQGIAAFIDARCDLYAFGVILFELLTGHYPFGECDSSLHHLQDILASRQVAPPLLRNWNRDVSGPSEAIVRRCLEPILTGVIKAPLICGKTSYAATRSALCSTSLSLPGWHDFANGYDAVGLSRTLPVCSGEEGCAAVKINKKLQTQDSGVTGIA